MSSQTQIPSPPTTLILIANDTRASVLFNSGPGQGLMLSRQRQWRAPKRSAGPGTQNAASYFDDVMTRSPRSEKIRAAATFAQSICTSLWRDLDSGLFDRLVIFANMSMLHNLRAALDPALHSVLAGVVAKDLTGETLDRIESEVGRILEI